MAVIREAGSERVSSLPAGCKEIFKPMPAHSLHSIPAGDIIEHDGHIGTLQRAHRNEVMAFFLHLQCRVNLSSVMPAS